MANKVNEFKANQKYEVLKDWSEEIDPFFRSKNVRHELKKGELVRFRSPNLGKAEFVDSGGKLIFLNPKVAFRIIGLCVS
jgi:hypothetical protein